MCHTNGALTLRRYSERGNLEVQLFNIQTKLRAARQKTWYPPEGKLVSDINKVHTSTPVGFIVLIRCLLINARL